MPKIIVLEIKPTATLNMETVFRFSNCLCEISQKKKKKKIEDGF